LTARYDSSPCADRSQNVVAFPSWLSATQWVGTSQANISPALTRLTPMAVAYSRSVGTDCYNGAITGDVAATLGTPGSSVNASGPTVMTSMQLRRLTPRECERLQGFPDDYTLIPYRGRPYRGHAAYSCPDGPRYKSIGNSMAVPVMRWIGERIAAAN
jgi:DNA (cytosine-5)-methyltransferase 1